MAQKLRKHGKNWKKTSVGCDIDFTILLSMLKVKGHHMACDLLLKKKSLGILRGQVFIMCKNNT